MKRTLKVIGYVATGAVGLLLVLSVFAIWISWFWIGPELSSRLGFLPAAGTATSTTDIVSTSGAIGDTFGPLNALFAAIASTAVIATLSLQLRQIRVTQEDQHRQRFESSFFELLRLMRELRSEVRFKHSEDYRSPKAKSLPIDYTVSYISQRERIASSSRPMRLGHEAIISAADEMKYWMRIARISNKEVTKDWISSTYSQKIHMKFESRFAPYYRVIYTILYRIDTDRILTTEEKRRYGNLLRSQLTSPEVALVAINALTPQAKDLRDLIIRFRLLKYMVPGVLLSELKKHYPPETFQGRDNLA